MQKETVKPDENEDDLRVLSSRGILAHYAHIKSQPGRTDERCGFCRSGVGAVITVVEREKSAAELAESDRVDKEKDAASTSDSWRVGDRKE